MTIDSKSVCVACKHSIPDGASKCAKCGIFQNAWRFLPFGQNSLALFIALASVIGLVGDQLYDLVAGEYTDIRMATVASNSLSVTMLASNSGTRAGVLSGAKLEIIGSWGNTIFDMSVADKAVFVEPGEDILVELSLTTQRSLSELLYVHFDNSSISKEDIEIYDCLIHVEHILYEDTLNLVPMNTSHVKVSGGRGSPRSSFLTRSLFCWELGLPEQGLSLSLVNETFE